MLSKGLQRKEIGQQLHLVTWIKGCRPETAVKEQKIRVNSEGGWTPLSEWCLQQLWVMQFCCHVPFVLSISVPAPSSAQAGSVQHGQHGQVPAPGRINPPLQLNGLLKQSLCWWGFANQAMGANHWHHWWLTAFQSLHALLGLLFPGWDCPGLLQSNQNDPSLLISLPNRTCSSILSCKWTSAQLHLFIHFFRITVLGFFSSLSYLWNESKYSFLWLK